MNEVKANGVFTLPSQEERLVVLVAIAREAHHMLVSVEQGLQSATVLLETVVGRHVADDVSEAILTLKLSELLLQPAELMAWINMRIVYRKVQRVASLIVKHNDLTSRVVHERLRVKAVLLELLGLLL